jgi:hypothetical protein
MPICANVRTGASGQQYHQAGKDGGPWFQVRILRTADFIQLGQYISFGMMFGMGNIQASFESFVPPAFTRFNSKS